MRLIVFVIALLSILSGAFAVDVEQSVIVTYPLDTPDSVLDQAKKAIEDAGGVITHNFQFIKYTSEPKNMKFSDLVSPANLSPLGALLPSVDRK
jgi:hypothetical protein